MGDWKEADEVQLASALDSWKPTPGTRLTGERNPGRRSVFSKKRLSFVDEPLRSLSWDFPPPFGRQEVLPFPLAETIVISRHLQTPEIHAYLNRAALDDIHDLRTPAPTPVDDSGRSDQRFRMEAIVRRGETKRRAAALGRDIYAITAPLVVEAAERILASDMKTAGTVAPGELFDAAAFLHALSPQFLSLTSEG